MYTRLMLCVIALVAVLTAPAAHAEDVSKLEWTTNYDDPMIGSEDARRGGTFYTNITAYPLTFRWVGPNSNDAFANWKNTSTVEFALISRHPDTDNYIPWMATHWSIQPDNKTVYYKLNPKARWSDGAPVTASDYVFTWNTLLDEKIIDPFWNKFGRERFESVEALDDYTLKIVGKWESWRPLADFSLFPMPEHSEAFKLTDTWTTDANNLVTPVVGPYVVSDREPGEFVTLDRVKDWWGTDEHYMRGMFNVDRIYLRVIPDNDRAFDFFKKGELSYYRVTTAKKWAEDMEFRAVQKGWAHRKRVFVDFPQGIYGFAMNLEKPIFQNKDFRKAIQYLFNFDEINDKLMYNAYYRQTSVFTGSEYQNKDLKPYGFDPRKATEHLKKAGYTKRGSDGILVNDKGERASITLTYGSKGLERHFTVVKQTFKRFGVEISLRLLEPGTAFRNGLERQYEMTTIARTSSLFPSPRQYFHSDFKETTNNNNIWSFGDPRADELIDIYRYDLDKEKRLAAMHELDALIHEEAFYVPFWQAPFLRFLYWDNVQFPENYFPKRTEQLRDWQVMWIDQEREQRLAEAMKSGTSLGQDMIVDVDAYGVKAAIEAAAGDLSKSGS